jgi:hypothetical protein
MLQNDRLGDQRMDENLRRLGRSTALPADPSPQQVASWKSGRPLSLTDARTAPAKGNWFMRQSRYWAAASTAIAAAVGLAVVLTPATKSSSAMAATIFESLRQTAHRGMRIQMSDMRVEGIEANINIEVLFERPITLARLFDEQNPDVPEPQSVFIELRANAGPDADADVAGLDVELALSHQPDDTWVFAKINQLPDQIVEEQPAIEAFLGFVRNGVLLDLNGLESMISDDFLDSMLGDDDEDVPAPVGDDDEDVPAPVVDATADPADASQPDVFDALAKGLLTGSLGRDELQQIVAQLGELAEETDVREVRPGQWQLTARKFRLDDMDNEEKQLLANAALQINYAEGHGVTKAQLTGVGMANGRLVFEFIDTIDPARASRKPYLDRGIPALNIQQLLASFGVSLSELSDEGDDDDVKTPAKPAPKEPARKPSKQKQ